MPRKTEEPKEVKSLKNQEKTKKTTSKSSEKNKNTKTTKNSTSKKEIKKKEDKTTKTTKPTKATKKTATTKTAKKSITSNTTSKSAVERKTKKASTKKSDVPKVVSVEYYDLPYRYNQTIVKVLAQTPKTLFVYWDISDEDRDNLKKQYGDDFFENTKPVLIIHNLKLNYSFEVEINDFANSWYLHVNDSKSDYTIELGRRPISNSNNNFNKDYIYVSSSNKIESPNDHILFFKDEQDLYFKNTKTNQISVKTFSNMPLVKSMHDIYNIYDLYKEIFKNQNVEDIYNLAHEISHTFTVDLNTSPTSIPKELDLLIEIIPFTIEQLMQNYLLNKRI